MFRGLINDAKSAASSLVLKYVARASVAIPFVIALGFALAALTVWLVNQYGYVTGYLLMAGGLAAIGGHGRLGPVIQGTRGRGGRRGRGRG